MIIGFQGLFAGVKLHFFFILSYFHFSGRLTAAHNTTVDMWSATCEVCARRNGKLLHTNHNISSFCLYIPEEIWWLYSTLTPAWLQLQHFLRSQHIYLPWTPRPASALKVSDFFIMKWPFHLTVNKTGCLYIHSYYWCARLATSIVLCMWPYFLVLWRHLLGVLLCYHFSNA